MKKASNFATSRDRMKEIGCLRLKFASGCELG
jgi:hypothetical protein